MRENEQSEPTEVQLDGWRVAFIKWLSDYIRTEDTWTGQELVEAAEDIDWHSDYARAFEAGYKAALRDNPARKVNARRS